MTVEPESTVALRDLTLTETRRRSVDVAILPWGATEAHNLHLPYGTDSIQADAIAVRAAELARDRGAECVVLPTVPFGVNVQQLDIPLTINMNPGTQARVLEDVIESLEASSVRRLLVLNGHGGNDFKPMIREAQGRTDIFLCAADWYRALPATEYFEEPGDHAGEMETSVMLHVAPDLVRPLADAGPGEARVFRVAALREGWTWAPRDWRKITPDTGVGDPRRATPEKGARFFRAATERIADFLVALATMDPDDPYVDAGADRDAD